ncbi:unnamed protein product [Allacma fusca]|uniref:Aldehyde oxidase/xanthine dehydrogenase second molybdopterin binding domain-containing protein n=1 Tax=Allacma fusca TaxID=39272 RepID=A0A8J2P2F0_9HEXA|nr:unnamed protein product [Allacma fusca]
MDIFAASQWIQQLQSAVASCLGIPNNFVNVQVKRLGGGFGSKIARSAHMVTACALAANKTKRPVRMVLDLETNMATLGKRLPYMFSYDVGFDDSGANTALTGAAITSEHICYAALKACDILSKRIEPIKQKLENPTWELLVAECVKAGIDLTSYYNTTYSDQLKDYAVWGLTACEVEVDCLTGEYKLIRVDLINDAGQSLSPDVDIGQVEGAFIFGIGMWLTEKIQHDQETGELLTNCTWEYKPPASKDIPEDFRVTLMRNASNPNGVLRSKATGEAPLCMSVSALFAIKNAIIAARLDAGNMEWFNLNGPVTPEDIQRLCLTSPGQFTI